MSQRIYHQGAVQVTAQVDYMVTFAPQGTAAPVLGEGDAGGTYIVLTRTGVGTYTVKTKDPFIAAVGYTGWVNLGTPAGQFAICFGTPVHNADNTFTFPFTIFNGAAAQDVAAAAGNVVTLALTMRNSSVKP